MSRQKLNEIFFLITGGILGVYLRYALIGSPLTIGFISINVLLVNVIDSFILDTFSILTFSWNLNEKYVLLVAVGFCGSFTTMSSFALETIYLLDNKQIWLSITNIFANITLPLGAVIAGRTFLNILLDWIFH